MKRTLALAIAMAVASAPASSAAPITGIAGYDYFTGPLGQRTHGVVAAGVVAVGEGDVLVAGSRFDDTMIGRGYGLTGGFGLPVVPMVRMRVAATRFLGDQSFRAWRTKAGPELLAPDGRRLQLSYVRYEDNVGATSDGMVAEATAPLIPNVTGRIQFSGASAPSGPSALQGSLGALWGGLPHLLLSADVGLARNAAGATGQPVPGHGGLLDGVPLLGGGGGGGTQSSSTEKDVSATVLLGVRITLP